jgi:hypothetical protein
MPLDKGFIIPIPERTLQITPNVNSRRKPQKWPLLIIFGLESLLPSFHALLYNIGHFFDKLELRSQPR